MTTTAETMTGAFQPGLEIRNENVEQIRFRHVEVTEVSTPGHVADNANTCFLNSGVIETQAFDKPRRIHHFGVSTN